MKTRLYQVLFNTLAIQSKLEKINDSKWPTNPAYFKSLNGLDVINAKVSDHHPIIHDGTLFWNIMMQGKERKGTKGTNYNNGFGTIENEKDYMRRLLKVTEVIAEVISLWPSIDVIGLCEGPIVPLHVQAFLQALKKHQSMEKFFKEGDVEESFHTPNQGPFPNWGLIMFADNKYKVNQIEPSFLKEPNLSSKLANRFQLWQLTDIKESHKYVALGHFPFGGDERVTEKQNISNTGKMYCHFIREIINHYSNEQFILCADFNLNPYLISEWNDRAMDMITNNNSILLRTEEKANNASIDTVTVDGILLSRLEKQRCYATRDNLGLFSRLKKENSLFESSVRERYYLNR